MAGQGILIIIIPNDLKNDEDKPANVAQIVTDPDRPPSTSESNDVTTAPSDTEELKQPVHSKEYPCAACGLSLTSRFRHHITPKLNLIDAIWILSEDRQNFFITCFAELGQHSDVIIEELRRAEIGIRTGSKVFILPLSCALGIQNLNDPAAAALVEINDLSAVVKDVVDTSTDENNEKGETKAPTDATQELDQRLIKKKSDFKRSIRARLTVLQVVNAIRGQTLFSFDFLLLTILASFIALLGLLEDNSVILVASMLVSPLMGPILGIVFGFCVGDRKLWRVGLRTETLGLVVAILTGFIGGLCTTWSEAKWGSSTSFPTREMRSRGDIRRLWYGALVALPSGAGAALSVLGGNVGSLVGVAISASLLPPAVNAGLLCSYSFLSALIPSIGDHSSIPEYHKTFNSLSNMAKNCTKFVGNDYIPIYSCDMSRETGLLGICSFVLTMTNIVCIIVMAMVILRIKEVVPIMRDDEIAQFWHDDVRIVRGQNKNIHRRDVINLVDMWKSMTGTGPSSLPMGESDDDDDDQNKTKPISESEIQLEQKTPLKHRSMPRLTGGKHQSVLARKLRRLQEFATAYDLNISNPDDVMLRTQTARDNVERMANDLIASIDETNRINLSSRVAQLSSSSARSRAQTLYQELLDVMPPKWTEVFHQCQEEQERPRHRSASNLHYRV